MNLRKKYFRQDERLLYTPEDGLVYDDSFSINLKKLLSGGKPLTIPQITEKLNMNGYIGRHKLSRVYKNGCYPLNQVRVKVDLIWSGTSYIWPRDGVFTLDNMRVVPSPNSKPLPVVLPNVVDIMFYHMNAGSYRVTKEGCISMGLYKECAAVLEKLGIIEDTDFKIVDLIELEEIKQNVLETY